MKINENEREKYAYKSIVWWKEFKINTSKVYSNRSNIQRGETIILNGKKIRDNHEGKGKEEANKKWRVKKKNKYEKNEEKWRTKEEEDDEKFVNI